MASVCTPVTVVSAMDGSRPHGTTVSAVMSLSLDPPMMAVSLDRESELLRIIRTSGRFGINFLAAEQHAVALACAGRGHGKFDSIDWTLVDGLPRIAAVSTWVACTVTSFTQGGDHAIVMGRVNGVDQDSVRPLTYHRREFGTHAALAIVSDADVR